MSIPRNVVAKFLRTPNGTPIGLVCATRGVTGLVTLGWSFVHKKDRKQGCVNKARAWQIALDRADRGTSARIPHALSPIVQEISDRAKRYFKVETVGI